MAGPSASGRSSATALRTSRRCRRQSKTLYLQRLGRQIPVVARLQLELQQPGAGRLDPQHLIGGLCWLWLTAQKTTRPAGPLPQPFDQRLQCEPGRLAPRSGGLHCGRFRV